MAEKFEMIVLDSLTIEIVQLVGGQYLICVEHQPILTVKTIPEIQSAVKGAIDQAFSEIRKEAEKQASQEVIAPTDTKIQGL